LDGLVLGLVLAYANVYSVENISNFARVIVEIEIEIEKEETGTGTMRAQTETYAGPSP
jgi:hypothetical protein